jgi:uncharacterized membrane protein
MESRVKLAGHAVHPMLIAFPLGLLSTAVVFDILFLVTGNVRWTETAYYMIGAGVIGGIAAAVPGWVDWVAIPGSTRAKRVGLVHGVGNVVVLGLFVLSWLLRRPDPSAPPTGAIVAGLAGVVILAVTGWLGGELMNRLGVGVDDGAHLDAPSSLSALPAAATPRAQWRGGFAGGDRRAPEQPAYAGIERRAGGPVR